MANIKLKNLSKQFSDNSYSSVNDLSNLDISTKTLYKDLKLDIEDVGQYNVNAINSEISVKDIDASINEAAILNSLKNWLVTAKYSRLLNPELSLDLRQYLFEGANEYTAYFLGLDIMRTLPFYEPRVKIVDCTIEVNDLEGYFIINLTLTIPSLNNKQINLKELLDSSGYTTL